MKISTNVSNPLPTVETEFVEIRSEVSVVIVIKDSITSSTAQVTSVVRSNKNIYEAYNII